MLACQDLAKSYVTNRERLDILRGISFELSPQECVVIAGKSGAGKSTFLSLLAGMLKPDSGEATFAGKNWTQMSTQEKREIWNQKIGFVFQSFQLVPYLSSLQNVALAAWGTDRLERSQQLLADFELHERLHSKPSQLSVGEQQRVAIARALINEPQVVIADEPTGNLDSETSTEVHQLLGRFRDNGGALLVVSHRPETEQLGDRLLQLSDGKLRDKKAAAGS